MTEPNFSLLRMPLLVSAAVILSACSGAPIRGSQSDVFNRQSRSDMVVDTSDVATTQTTTTEQYNASSQRNVAVGPKTMNSGVVVDDEVNSLRRELQYANLRNQSGGLVIISADPSQTPLPDNTLLPPNARPGECYARVFIPPQYEEYTERVLVSEPSEEIKVIPAQYTEMEQRIEVAAATKRYETLPAVYKTVDEKVLVREKERSWKVALAKDAAPANKELLRSASEHGIDLNTAQPNMCYHEHYEPAQYDVVNEEIIVKDGAEEIEIQHPEYKWVEKEIVVKEASYEMKSIPAQYETVTEQVIDKPAHTVWKKGTGPIQKIDESTGEIMCLVEVPATYKTITSRKLIAPARTERVEIPAVKKTVKVKVLANQGNIKTQPIAPERKTVQKRVKVADERFYWHEVHNNQHPANTRTGNQICLVETPEAYETVQRQVLVKAAERVQVEVPAQFETVKVNKLVSQAQEVRTNIPAEYDQVTHQRLIREGYMEWRSILCETNMTRSRLTRIQQALKDRGFDPGPIDGVIGRDTMIAVNNFQRSNNLPVDEYLNIETIQALGVTPR